MRRAGFVMVGGRSSRMGRDKALLSYRGRTLTEHVAEVVKEVTGSVTLIGEPGRYQHLGYKVIPDIVPGCGPLGGIRTALEYTEAEWNLITACDMPGLKPDFLCRLLDTAEAEDADCLMPESPSGRREPLCAVYRRTCLEAVERALKEGRWKTGEALEGSLVVRLRIGEAAWFENLNTPEDWSAHLKGSRQAFSSTTHD